MKPNVLLDLDNTLIYSISASKAYKYPSLRKHYFEDMVILERPYLADFLTILGKYYNVSVWTAAQRDYASFIVNNILIHHVEIFHLFDRQHVQDSLYYFGTMKNLDLLTKIYKIPMFIQHKNIMVDDLLEICQQKNPCLNVVPFTGQSDDNDLLVKLNILTEFTEHF
jgi:hypothetical protein